MRALTLTQPWAGLVASGIKLIENRPRSIIKREDFGKRFAIHASRTIDMSVYARIAQIAPDVLMLDGDGSHVIPCLRYWPLLAEVTSAVIAVATVDKVFEGGWDSESIPLYADEFSYSNGEKLGPSQVRWFFGPIGYVLRDVVALKRPIPCRGMLGFWTLPADVERQVEEQLR